MNSHALQPQGSGDNSQRSSLTENDYTDAETTSLAPCWLEQTNGAAITNMLPQSTLHLHLNPHFNTIHLLDGTCPSLDSFKHYGKWYNASTLREKLHKISMSLHLITNKKLWDAAWDMWQHRNFILKNDRHKIEAYVDLMEKSKTRIIYHHQRSLQGLPETYLYLFERSTK